MKLDPTLQHTQKSTQNKDLNKRPETTELLEENRGKYLGIGLSYEIFFFFWI